MLCWFVRVRAIGSKLARSAITALLIAVIYSGTATSPGMAQAVPPPPESPWNMQQVFERVPFAQRWELQGIEDIPPEDRPVGTRVHPGYQPPGIRAGDWMFNPTATSGVIYNSNVFSSANDVRSDAVLRVEPRLHAYTLWRRHFLDVDAYVRSDTYRRHSGLDQVDASIRARGRLDIRHDMAILANLRAAHLNEPVGSLSSPTGAVEPTPYDLLIGDVTYW